MMDTDKQFLFSKEFGKAKGQIIAEIYFNYIVNMYNCI